VELRKKVINTFLWSLLEFISSKFLRLASNLILTRLLFPDLFGLIAIIYVVISSVAMLTDIGVGPYLIQHKKDNSPDILNTAWTLQIIRGVVVWLVICALSICLYYYQSLGLLNANSVYSHEQLPLLIAIASCSMVISGFNSISIHSLSRELNVKRIIIITFVSRLISIISMLTIALYNPTIWVLISGALIYAFIYMIASHVFLPSTHIKRLMLDRKIVSQILHFGKWVFVSTMMTLAVMNGDRIILSGFVNSELLGFYAIAFLFIDAAKGLFSTINQRVWFPLLSTVKRGEQGKLQEVYYRIRLYQDMISYTLVGVLFVVAPLIIGVLYDERYSEVGYIFSILSLSVTAVGLTTIESIFISLGLSKYTSFINVSRAIFLWVGLYFVIDLMGFTAALWYISLVHILSIPIALFLLKKCHILVWYKEFWTLPFLFVGYLLGTLLSALFLSI